VADARYAVRGLRRQPGFATVAILTLALGIGATPRCSAWWERVMLRPLPYRDADRLALGWTDDTKRPPHRAHVVSSRCGWRTASHTLSDVAFYNTQRPCSPVPMAATHVGALASGNLFTVLGVAAARGRALSPEDEAGAASVALISHSLWQRRFGGDPNVSLGR